MYLINTAQDYADEFDYPVTSIMSEEVRDFILENEDNIDDMEEYFGTNEFLDFSTEDIISLVTNAKDITTGERATLVKFGALTCGLDIVERVIDRLADKDIIR